MAARKNYPWHIDLPRGRRPIKVFKTRRGEYVAGIKMPNGNYLTHDFADGYMRSSHLELFDHSDIVGAANGGIVRSYPTEVEAVAQLLQSIHVFMHGPNDDSLLHYPEIQKWRKLGVAQVFGATEEQPEMRTNPTQHHDLDIAELAARANPMMLRSTEQAMEYGKMVADAYRAAPSYDEKEAWRWHLLADHISKMFKRIQRGKQGVEVIFVPGQPYNSAEQLKREVAATGKLYISTDYNEHPIFTPEQNLEFRAVHDYIVHIGRDVDFSMRGEAAAYNAHARLAPPDTMPALFTEIVGQAAPSSIYGVFDEQKIVLLPFDYHNVGIEVAGPRPNRLTPNQRGQLTTLVDEDTVRRSRLGRKRANVTPEGREERLSRLRARDNAEGVPGTRPNRLTTNQRSQLTALVDEDVVRRSRLGRKRANGSVDGVRVQMVDPETGNIVSEDTLAQFRADNAHDPEVSAALDWIDAGSTEVPVGLYILRRVGDEARENRLTTNQRSQLTALVDEDAVRRSRLGRKRANGAVNMENTVEKALATRENRLTTNQRSQLTALVDEDVVRRSRLGRKRANGSVEEARDNASGVRERRRKRGEHEHLLAQIQMTSQLLSEAEVNRPPREVERLSTMLYSLVEQAEHEGLREQAEWAMRHGRYTASPEDLRYPSIEDRYDASAYHLIPAAQDAEERRLRAGTSTRGAARQSSRTASQRSQPTAHVDAAKPRRPREVSAYFGSTNTNAELLKALSAARKHYGEKSGPFSDDVPQKKQDAAMKEFLQIEAEAQSRGVRKNPTARERAALEMLLAEHEGRVAKRNYAAKKPAAKKPAAKKK